MQNEYVQSQALQTDLEVRAFKKESLSSLEQCITLTISPSPSVFEKWLQNYFQLFISFLFSHPTRFLKVYVLQLVLNSSSKENRSAGLHLIGLHSLPVVFQDLQKILEYQASVYTWNLCLLVTFCLLLSRWTRVIRVFSNDVCLTP